MPPGERKSGIPESVETPAPVNTTMRRAGRSSPIAAAIDSMVVMLPSEAALELLPMAFPTRAVTGRAARLTVAALLAGLLLPAVPAVPAVAQEQTTPTRLGAVTVVLVRSWTMEQARSLAEQTRFDGPSRIPAAVGLVSTLPPGASYESRVLSLATGRRVDAKALREGVSPATIQRLKEDNPDAEVGGLPPVRAMADAGLEDAGLFGLGAGAPVEPTLIDSSTPRFPSRPAAAPARPGTIRPAQQQPDRDADLVVAVEDAARLATFVPSLVRTGRVMVVGLEPQPGRARTAPYAELGGQAGLVTSDGTRRAGLVALEDVRATVLSANGQDPGRGTPVRVAAAEDPVGAVTVLDRQVAALVAARTFAIPAAVGAGIFAALAAVLALRRRGRTLTAVARALVLLALAVPSGYLVASRVAPPSGPAWLGLGLAVAVLAAVAAGRAGRYAPAALGGLLLVLVTLDLLGGGEALSRPLLGGSAYDGERFYGLGNGYFAYFLTAAALVIAFLPVRRVVAVALFTGVALVDGLPALGADVGGALTAMLTAAVAWVLLAPRPVRPGRVVLIVAVALVAGLVLALGAGALTGDATHASRFAGEVAGGGPAVALRVFAHKLEVNAALLATNPFAWAGPLAVALAAALALRGSGWSLRPRPSGAATRAAAAGAGRQDAAAPAPAASAPAAPAPGPNGLVPDVLGERVRLGGLAGVAGGGAAAPGPNGLVPDVLGERVRLGVLAGVAGSVALIALNDTGVTAAAGSGMFLLLALAWAALAGRTAGRATRVG